MLLDAYGRPVAGEEESFAAAESVRQPSGHIIVNGQQAGDTRQCVHCGGHFLMLRGSGRRRGFCTLCHGITCGSPGCEACVPAEKRLEQREAVGRQQL